MTRDESVWNRFNGSYVLPADEVHVHQTTLNLPESSFSKLWQSLQPDERQRASRFYFEVDKRRCVIGRGLLRLLLGRILGLPADQLRFAYDEFGKPSLIAEQGLPLQFNLSHSGEVILIAITVDRAVGVDVEIIRTDLDIDSIAARFFSASEYKILASLTGQMRYEAFFACWTRKEAYLKARGVGLSLPLDQFDVSFLPTEEPRLLATRFDPAEACHWTLRALDLGGDYAAALAATGSAWKLKCWDCDALLLMEGAPEVRIRTQLI